MHEIVILVASQQDAVMYESSTHLVTESGNLINPDCFILMRNTGVGRNKEVVKQAHIISAESCRCTAEINERTWTIGLSRKDPVLLQVFEDVRIFANTSPLDTVIACGPSGLVVSVTRVAVEGRNVTVLGTVLGFSE